MSSYQRVTCPGCGKFFEDLDYPPRLSSCHHSVCVACANSVHCPECGQQNAFRDCTWNVLAAALMNKMERQRQNAEERRQMRRKEWRKLVEDNAQLERERRLFEEERSRFESQKKEWEENQKESTNNVSAIESLENKVENTLSDFRKMLETVAKIKNSDNGGKILSKDIEILTVMMETTISTFGAIVRSTEALAEKKSREEVTKPDSEA